MKKGFTLVELLAVIAIVAVLAVFIVPNILKTFKSSKEGLSRIQKEQILNAATMYINDTCKNPISDEYECTINSFSPDSGIVNQGQIELDTLVELGYLDSHVVSNCEGEIYIDDDEISTDEITCNFNN